MSEAVYLLHFERAIHNSRHYVGFTTDLDARIRQHRGGYSGAAIVREFHRRGIGFVVARIWENAPRTFERKLKTTYKNAPRLCPECRKQQGGKCRK